MKNYFCKHFIFKVSTYVHKKDLSWFYFLELSWPELVLRLYWPHEINWLFPSYVTLEKNYSFLEVTIKLFEQPCVFGEEKRGIGVTLIVALFFIYSSSPNSISVYEIYITELTLALIDPLFWFLFLLLFFFNSILVCTLF